MSRRPTLLLLVCLCALPACKEEKSQGPEGTDVIHFGNDTSGTDASQDAVPDQFVGPDTTADGPLADVADVSDDLPADTSLPDTKDTAVPDNTVQPDQSHPDVVPDLPEDTTQPDVVTPCGGVMCPAELPLCINNTCQCNGSSCPDDQYCKGGVCADCTVDNHCGPNCVSCAQDGNYCHLEGERCVECDQNHPCPSSKSCVEDKCVSCEAQGLCGTQCLTCQNETPVCTNGQCVCDETSCGAAADCVDGVCVGCTESDPLHCGTACLVCSGVTPHCKAGACTICNTDAECGPSCQACGGTTPYCRPDGVGCVACLTTEQCGNNYHCDGGQCVANCVAYGCTGVITEAKKCSSPILVGRLEAMEGKTYAGDTTNDGDDDDLPSELFGPTLCWDAMYDNFYRIYLISGDVLKVDFSTTATKFDAMMKLYTGTECDSNGTSDLISCYNGGGDGGNESLTYTATADGWYTVVVDGRNSTSEDYDYGPYSVTFKITCANANCCCG